MYPGMYAYAQRGEGQDGHATVPPVVPAVGAACRHAPDAGWSRRARKRGHECIVGAIAAAGLRILGRNAALPRTFIAGQVAGGRFAEAL